MDVNTIINNLNSVNEYNNSSQNLEITKTNDNESSSTSKQNIKQCNDNSNKLNDRKDPSKAIDELNKLLEKDNTHAEYSEYKKLGRSIVKIVNDKTNKVVMEIPEKQILDVIARILENAGLLDKKA